MCGGGKKEVLGTTTMGVCVKGAVAVNVVLGCVNSGSDV